MRFIVLALAIASTVAILHPVSREIVNEIKAKADTWTPMEPEENPFAYMSIEQIKGMMGYKRSPKIFTSQKDRVSAPDSFDSRTQWQGAVHPIRDQKQCGSCWAFAASEALTDRFHIASKGAVDLVLSPQYLVSCDTNNFGCNGGYLDAAWEFLENTGIPTDDCVPYTSGGGIDGDCPATCADGSDLKMYKATNVKQEQGIDAMKNAIMSGGPVEVGFDVYNDFMSYKSGIYKQTSSQLLGGHAVKAIGWGVQNGTKYWIMANSWNVKWGESGFFRIAFEECGIEDEVNYGTPVVDTFTSE